jgi:hypothetical protein
MASMENPVEWAAETALPPEPSSPACSLPAAPNEQKQAREPGWLLPTLLRTETILHGRWDYLAECWEKGELLPDPIPRILFLSTPDKKVWKMLTTSLDAIPNYGHAGWMGWGGSEYFRFFLD